MRERVAIFKAAFAAWMDHACRMVLPAPYSLCYWWPWVKNYYGETTVGFLDQAPILSRVWIDQNLKKAMGY